MYTVVYEMKFISRNKSKNRPLHGISDLEMLTTSVSQWFRTPQGCEVLETERAITGPIINRLFGYHILQMSCDEKYSLIDESPAGQKIVFAPAWRADARSAVADNGELPLASDSIDVVVIHHALDFTDDSHRLLREATRVLRPGGQMLVIGFNPYSHWGIWKIFKRKLNIPWRGRFISKGRLTDWLRLLNLRTDSIEYGLHFLPLKNSWLLKYAQKIERFGSKIKSPLGGAYFLLCVKQLGSMTPIHPKWRPVPATVAGIVAGENARIRIH